MSASYSDNPANIRPKKSMVKPLCPELGSMKFKYVWERFAFNLANSKPLWKYFCEIMKTHDANPAIVCSTRPLLVAAYSCDLDCAVLIRYPDEFVNRFGLKQKMKLLSVNSYDQMKLDDVVPGPRSSGLWGSFLPRIANFLSDDEQMIKRKINGFSLDVWDRVWECGVEYAKRFPHHARGPNPLVLETTEY